MYLNIINNKNFKFRKFVFVGALSFIVTILLINAVLEIGDYTSNFGNKFKSQRLLIIEKEYEIREASRASSRSYGKTKIGNHYVIKDVLSIKGWVKVDPVHQEASPKERKKLNNFFDDEGAYIDEDAGEIITPFQQNLENFKNDNSNGRYSLGPLLTFFTARTNIKYIYWLMAIFLIVFNWHIFKRLIYLWLNYKSQQDIEEKIFEQNTDIENCINELEPNRSHFSDIIPLKFISEIHNSFKLEGSNNSFNKIYKDFQDNERDATDNFLDDLRVCNVWIIRSGILGTLVGLIIAFFELYIGMGDVEPEQGKVITDVFVGQIQQALLGNALAIATSITAHGIALVSEVLIGNLIRNEDNTQWIQSVYPKILSLKDYSPKPARTKTIINKVDTSFKTMMNEVDKISAELKLFTPMAKEGKNLFDEFNSNLSDLNESMRNLENSVNNADEITNTFSNEYTGLTNSTKQFVKKINQASVHVEELNSKTSTYYDYLSDHMNSMKEKSTNLLENIKSALGTFGEKLANIKNSLNRKEDDE